MFDRITSEIKLIWNAIPDLHLSWRIYFFTMPVSIFSITFNSPVVIEGAKEFLTLCLVAIAGHLAMLPFLIYGRYNGNIRQNYYLLALMGLARGVAITWGEAVLGVEDNSTILIRAISSAILIVYWFQIGSIFIEFFLIFRQDIRRLIEESILKNSVIELPKRDLNSKILLARISELQSRVTETLHGQPTREMLNRRAVEIDELVKEQIRPFSFSEWREGELVWVRAGLGKVAITTLKRQALPLWGIVSLILPGLLMVQIPKYGFLIAIGIHAVWIILLGIARIIAIRVMPERGGSFLAQNLFFFGELLLLIGPAKIYLTVLLTSDTFPLKDVFQTQLLSMLHLVIFCVVAALCLSLRDDETSVFREISEQLKDKDLAGFIERGIQSNADAEYAQYLHAEVQSQLLACKLLLLRSAESDEPIFSPEVRAEISRRLGNISQPYVRPSAVITRVRVEALSQSWRGLAEITADLDSDLDGDHVPHEVVSQLIEEAVVNAIKHGKAKNIYIKATPASSAITVEIYDDGSLNEVSKGSGLGSILFDTFAHNWSLGRAEDKTLLTFSVRNLTSAE